MKSNKKIAIATTEEIVAEIMAAEPVVVVEEAAPVVEEVAPVIEEEPVILAEVIVEDDEIKEVIIPKKSGFEIGDEVKLVYGAKFASGKNIPEYLFNSKLYVRQINGEKYGIATKLNGTLVGTVNVKDLTGYVEEEVISAESYLALILADEVKIKSRPEESGKTLKTISKNGIFTVVDEKDGWAHLKIGGWIPMNSFKKIVF
jgi:hypothetical protein